MELYAGKTILVLGAGSSGLSAARLALREGARVTVLDTGTGAALRTAMASLSSQGAETISGEEALKWKGHADLAVFSPGIPVTSPLAMLAQNIPQTSELAFGAQFLSCPILAVTGTNGKTTTVEMLEFGLKGMGLDAIAAGNIGLPISEVILQGRKPEILVAEISSFQMEHPGNFAPKCAALLNITPDHLNRHGSWENYISAKLALFRHAERAILNLSVLQIEQVRKSLQLLPQCTFSALPEGGAQYCVSGGCLGHREADGSFTQLLHIGELHFEGKHNLENALAAMAMAGEAGLDVAAFARQLLHFHTGDHRLQTVAQGKGLQFVDDSKATNVDALIKALEAFHEYHGPIALIAGGLDKGCTLEEALPLVQRRVSKVFLIGQCRERLLASWSKTIPCVPCGSMADAVARAAASLPQGGLVLLSPACASMDMFRDYADRGNQFRDAALEFLAKMP